MNYKKVLYSLKSSTISVSTDGATQYCADLRHKQLRQQMYVSYTSIHSVSTWLGSSRSCSSHSYDRLHFKGYCLRFPSASSHCPVRTMANRLSVWHTYIYRTASNGKDSGFYSAGALIEPRQEYGLSRQVFHCLLQSFRTNTGEEPRTLIFRPFNFYIFSIPCIIPYILESNPHPFYSFRGLKNQMRIRIACRLDSRSRGGFWKNDRVVVRAERTIQ